MVGFRTVAGHDYRKLNLEVVRHILDSCREDFLQFGEVMIRVDVVVTPQVGRINDRTITGASE
jgi:hypothetical protein